MTHKNFAFIRVAPIHQWGMGRRGRGGKPGKNTGLAGHVAHDLRFLVTPNADPNRMQNNLILCEKTGWKAVYASQENLEKLDIHGPEFVSELAQKKLAEKGIKAQKNHVKAAAFMLGVSPEFLRDGTADGNINPQKVKAWMRATVKYMRKKHGDTLLMISFHMDELNPHASAYTLPIREKLVKPGGRPRKDEKGKPREPKKEWRLDYWEIYTRDVCKYEIDKETNEKKLVRIQDGTCTQMQDEYHQAMLDEGLNVQRGMRKDPNAPALKHQTIRKYYGNKKRALEEVSRMTPDDLRDFVVEKVELINKVDRLIEERDHYQIAGGTAQQKAAELEKKIADSMRDIPVANVIRAITGVDPTQPPHGPKDPLGSPPKQPTATQLEFKLPNGQRLGVDSAKNRFQNLTPHIPFLGEGASRLSGIGSINAVMYLTGCSYVAATARLANLFGTDAAKRAAAQKIEQEAAAAQHRLVVPDESQWDALHAKLQAWKINEDCISALRKAHRIAANSEGHAVFRKEHWDENDQLTDTGHIVIDPAFAHVKVIETGDNGMLLALDKTATHTVICATPTDALAIKSLPEHKNANVLALGHNPNQYTIRSLDYFLNDLPDAIYYAENLLESGRKIAKWLAEHYADQIKMIPLPDGFRHWLDYHLTPIKAVPEQKIVSIRPPKLDGPTDIAME